MQSARDETRDLQPDGPLELYFVAGMAMLCFLAVWEWLWDQFDAWWAGSQASQASSRRARRLRRMQRAIEDVVPCLLDRLHAFAAALTACKIVQIVPASPAIQPPCVSSLPKQTANIPKPLQIHRGRPGLRSIHRMNSPKSLLLYCAWGVSSSRSGLLGPVRRNTPLTSRNLCRAKTTTAVVSTKHTEVPKGSSQATGHAVLSP